jgi:CRISPR-associated protein Cmr6
MNGNLGYIFYKDIYDIGSTIVSDPDRIESFLETTLERLSEKSGVQHFTLETTYPGLTTGIGLTHGVHDDDNDFKIGFSFNHTSGLPAIPGSSVKGLLRSVFPDIKSKEEQEKVKAKWIQALLDNIGKDEFPTAVYQPVDSALSEDQKLKIKAIEDEIFEGIREEKTISIYNRDIFHDAHIVSTGKNFLGTDYITPHLNPLKNPKPIKFLKILPEIKIEFSFDLKNGLLLIDQKILLFKKILLTIGVGAKTNVGYGQLVLPKEMKKGTTKEITEPSLANLPANTIPTSALPKLLKGAKFPGTIIHRDENIYIVSFIVSGQECILRKKIKENEIFDINEKIIVEFNNNYLPNNPNMKIRHINPL